MRSNLYTSSTPRVSPFRWLAFGQRHPSSSSSFATLVDYSAVSRLLNLSKLHPNSARPARELWWWVMDRSMP